MRTIGFELAVAGAHKAIVADDQGKFVTPLVTIHARARDLDRLIAQARQGAASPELQAVMEPTGMAWLPVAAYLSQQQITTYLVNGQQVADLRRYYKRHAKSDRIDARVLTSIPRVNPDGLHALVLANGATLACQRGCRELDRLQGDITAISNRLQAVDRFAWPGLEKEIFADPLGRVARWFRQHWYDPHAVVAAGAAAIRQAWQSVSGEPAADGAWAESLVQLATEVLLLYGSATTALDFALLQAEVTREQEHLALLEQMQHDLLLTTVRRLYRQIHPSRHLETIKGVGPEGAAVYASFIGNTSRFPSLEAFRGWTGMVPDSKQSAASEAKGLHITKAGPDMIKKFAYLDAESARQWDPQIAALYYDQIVRHGKHHTQAVCACATHLLDRIFVVLRDDRAYEVRDVDGKSVTGARAREIVTERYTVPAEVRKRTNKQARRAQRDRQAEKKQARESAPPR